MKRLSIKICKEIKEEKEHKSKDLSHGKTDQISSANKCSTTLLMTNIFSNTTSLITQYEDEVNSGLQESGVYNTY